MVDSILSDLISVAGLKDSLLVVECSLLDGFDVAETVVVSARETYYEVGRNGDHLDAKYNSAKLIRNKQCKVKFELPHL